MAKTTVEAPNGLRFVGATRRRVGAVPGQPEDEVTYEGGCSCSFRTSGWPRKAMAEERIAQHLEEHRTGDGSATPELADFKRAVGYDVDVAEPPSLDPFGDDPDGENPILSASGDEADDDTTEA